MTIKDLLTTFREKFKIVSVGVGDGADADILQITHSDGKKEIASNLDYMESFLKENIEKMVREACGNEEKTQSNEVWISNDQRIVAQNELREVIKNHLGIK